MGSDKTRLPTAPPNSCYEIRQVPGKGCGCFATAPIKRGTRILADSPLVIVPIAKYLASDIGSVFEKLTADEQAQYLSLHSGHGQDPKTWPSRIHESVTPRERQRIQEQHEARVGTEPTLISIFQVNCMELDGGAAVFPHAARFNHACNPNATFSWNPAIGQETIHAMQDIDQGDEITLSYCDMSHERQLRGWELKHYGFVCNCKSCEIDADGDTADGTWAYQSAQRRFRLEELAREVRHLRGPRIEKGAQVAGFVPKMLEMAKLLVEEGDWTPRLANVFLDIALVCELKGEFKSGCMAADKAVQVKKDCQGEDYPDYDKYVEVLVRMRIKLGQQKA
ncbi:hypothetical protein ACEQ8H_002488 [Pleosporales sp. CAS-2024a]